MSLKAKIESVLFLTEKPVRAQAIARIVNENYIDDSRTTVLTRYFMLTFTWNLRNLAMEGEKKKLQSGNSQFGPPHGPPPHGHP